MQQPKVRPPQRDVPLIAVTKQNHGPRFLVRQKPAMQFRAVRRLKPGILEHDAGRMPVSDRRRPRDEDERHVEPAQRVEKSPEQAERPARPLQSRAASNPLAREQSPMPRAGAGGVPDTVRSSFMAQLPVGFGRWHEGELQTGQSPNRPLPISSRFSLISPRSIVFPAETTTFSATFRNPFPLKPWRKSCRTRHPGTKIVQHESSRRTWKFRDQREAGDRRHLARWILTSCRFIGIPSSSMQAPLTVAHGSRATLSVWPPWIVICKRNTLADLPLSREKPESRDSPEGIHAGRKASRSSPTASCLHPAFRKDRCTDGPACRLGPELKSVWFPPRRRRNGTGLRGGVRRRVDLPSESSCRPAFATGHEVTISRHSSDSRHDCIRDVLFTDSPTRDDSPGSPTRR